MDKFNWMEEATCRGMDVNIFMPDDEGKISLPKLRAAQKICAECPVKQECLQYAIDLDITVGIYGGISNKARREYKSGKKKATYNKPVRKKSYEELKHGTMNAYSRHGCRCEPCKEVARIHWQEMGKKNRQAAQAKAKESAA